MACHLATRGVTACDSTARWPVRSPVLEDVSCTRCLRILRKAHKEADERKRAADRHALVVSMGLGRLWDHVDQQDSATCEMLRNIVYTLARYLDETGYVDDQPEPLRALASP